MDRTYSELLFGLGKESSDPLRELKESEVLEVLSPDEASDSKNRILVGWETSRFDVKEDIDRNVAEFSAKLGEFKYNFVVYPVGGVKRAFFELNDQNRVPPPINVPDKQLKNHLWETYFCGQISPWINCDSNNEEYAQLSENELLKELNYGCYLGVKTIVLSLKEKKSPRLAKIINKWLWTRGVQITLWILLPSSFENSETGDIWTLWADFRRLCANYSSGKLQAAITISPELEDEFLDNKLIDRWKAEPVGAIFVDSDIFYSGQDGNAQLPQSHINLLQKLWMSDMLRLVVRQKNDQAKYNMNLRAEYTKALRNAVQNVTLNMKKDAESKDGFLAEWDYNYFDVLQAPLQPLADNLESSMYDTFEQDPIKYRKYKEAVHAAIKDFGETSARPESIVIYLLGGGRGPLATRILEAEKMYNDSFRTKKNRLKVKLFIVEKNTNAIVTLNYMNSNFWKERATIIESDMRSLPELAVKCGYDQPDIIVSELLGSFGDNELSPECLDGVTEFLKLTTISIPSKYTSYLAPIMSLTMYQSIVSPQQTYFTQAIFSHSRIGPQLDSDGSYVQKYPQGFKNSRLDQIYVSYLRQFCQLADAEKCFVFNHPNFENASNERSTIVEFDIDRTADVMGFAGYFDTILYKDIMLSIEPKTKSAGMVSWFPAVVPLRELQRVENGDKLRCIIERKVDPDGVWYEWCAEIEKKNGKKYRSILQNVNGESYYMRK